MRITTAALTGLVAGSATAFAGGSPTLSMAAAVLAPLTVAIGPRLAAGIAAGLRTPGRGERSVTEQMSGTEFEEHVANIARSAGTPVIMTPLSGDWGVDLIIGARPHRIAVQCKRYSRPVGPGAVQEVVAGAPMQDCARTMVVTNTDFTPAARKLAERHGTILVGGAELPRLRRIIAGLGVTG